MEKKKLTDGQIREATVNAIAAAIVMAAFFILMPIAAYLDGGL